MRASWTGYFRIGDVNLPVKLFTATRSMAPRFIQLHAEDHSPVTRVTVCMQDGRELREDDLIRAAEYDGKYIEITENDIERQVSLERNIVIRQFSEPQHINSIYYDKPYYLVPSKGGELAYAILRRAFVKAKKIAIITFLFYEKERIGVVSVHEGMLVLQTLRFADEIIAKNEVKTPALPQPAPAQVSVATRLMEQYSSEFYLEDYKNIQRDHLNELIERKAKGLSLKKTSAISRHTTPENEVLAKMKALLNESPKSIKK